MIRRMLVGVLVALGGLLFSAAAASYAPPSPESPLPGHTYDSATVVYDGGSQGVDTNSASARRLGSPNESAPAVSGHPVPTAPGGVAANAGPRLSLDRIKFTTGGVDAVERHLGRFPDAGDGLGAAEVGMVARLRSIASGDLAPAAQGLRFYSHELRESVLYRKAGYPSGQPTGDAGYELWDGLHTQALNDYGFPRNIAPAFLYHPSILGGG